MKKLIILDRDGVINYDSENYIKSPAEWIPIPGSLEAIASLNKAGYLVAIASNQSGIGRGLFSEATLALIHTKMQQALQEKNAHIDAIFYCPHTPEDRCECRKPKPGLLHQAAERFHCSLQGVLFIGDSLRDIEAAQVAGCIPILVQSGNSISAEIIAEKNIAVFTDLAHAVKEMLHE